MKSKDFEWQTDEFMLYCRSTQLREKTMSSYEQTLHLFGRWLADELKIVFLIWPRKNEKKKAEAAKATEMQNANAYASRSAFMAAGRTRCPWELTLSRLPISV